MWLRVVQCTVIRTTSYQNSQLSRNEANHSNMKTKTCWYCINIFIAVDLETIRKLRNKQSNACVYNTITCVLYMVCMLSIPAEVGVPIDKRLKPNTSAPIACVRCQLSVRALQDTSAKSGSFTCLMTRLSSAHKSIIRMQCSQWRNQGGG